MIIKTEKMKRSSINPMPEYFEGYINLVEDIELNDALHKCQEDLEQLDEAALVPIGDKAYAPGKWTVKEVLQHLIDSERVMSYRALRFARNDKTPLPGFDQDLFAANAGTAKKTVAGLLAELRRLRASTIDLFDDFDDDVLTRKGISNNKEMTPLALGFIIAGHQIHHLNILTEKYLPLRNQVS